MKDFQCPYCDSKAPWVEGDQSYNCTGCPEFWGKQEVRDIRKERFKGSRKPNIHKIERTRRIYSEIKHLTGNPY